MCRNIKTLFNFAPPATDEEIRAAAIQFVRKLSGSTKPSRANEAAFQRAVDQVSAAAHELLDTLVTTTPPKDREVEAAAARARSAKRFGPRKPREGVVAAGVKRPRPARKQGEGTPPTSAG